MATTTPTPTITLAIAKMLCVVCDGDTDKFVDDYDGHCEDCYTQKFHPQVWDEIQEKRHLEKRRLMSKNMDESLDDPVYYADGSFHIPVKHKCTVCDEMFRVNEDDWYNGEHWGRPVCYDCFDDDECY
jgi:hypothetical protein